MKQFRVSFIITFFALAFVSYIGYIKGGLMLSFNMFYLTLILILMEISLSFDNAVVNASILKHWNKFWQKIFLTIGVLIAVFGMRLIFPLLIVSLSANLSLIEVYTLALNNPDEYSNKLISQHIQISAFGSMFLLLVFLNFIFDEKKDIFWFKLIEKPLVEYAKYRIIPYLIAITILIFYSSFILNGKDFLFAGFWGIIIYLFIQVICYFLEKKALSDTKAIQRGSIGGFLYLELLDASFSFDGVVGAFAITKDIIVIMIGLGVGALFVRSITIYLVEKGTLKEYIYLEHGAYWAICILAIIMLLNTTFHIPEVLSGTVGIFVIILSVYSSLKKID